MKRYAMVGLVVLGLLLAGCGGGSGKTKNPSFNQAQATAAIKTAYTTVFSAGGNFDQKATYIEDGATVEPLLRQLSTTALGKSKIQTTVTKVTFSSHTSANVNFTVTLGGSPFQLTGKAIYQDGRWKVAKETFCGLASQATGGKLPAVCSTSSK